MDNNRVLLINFYSPKSLGFRFLEHALTQAGFEVTVLYFKGFHSSHPKMPTEAERKLMTDLVRKVNPLMIGMSVMSSLYLEAVEALSKLVRVNAVGTPVVWGGVYATLFPERCLPFCDFVLRGEGEEAIVDLARRIDARGDVTDTQNLAYTGADGVVVNPVRPIEHELDKLGMAPIGLPNKYFIDNDVITNRDPMLDSISYETAGSRGCPFVCAYCSTVSLKRIYKDGGYLRFRSVDNLMAELKDAKSKMKKLKAIHFWDEIFPDDEKWINEFAERYKKEIHLPFEIWAHPLKTNDHLIKKLLDAGLYQIVMGIQSGSPGLRREVFHRVETQEQILAAAKVFAENKVPQVYYDFILRHPLETIEQLRETYELCTRLPGNFTLQLHELNFLPGTDIVQMALDRGLYTKDEIEKIMYAPMDYQYSSWWGQEDHSEETNFWYRLIFMTQFKNFRSVAARLAKTPEAKESRAEAARCYRIGMRQAKLRHYWKKGIMILKGTAIN